jgi:hypothetical protein
MKPLSAMTTGWSVPGVAMLMTGDLPRAWIFLSSGGAKCVCGLRWKIWSSYGSFSSSRSHTMRCERDCSSLHVLGTGMMRGVVNVPVQLHGGFLDRWS